MVSVQDYVPFERKGSIGVQSRIALGFEGDGRYLAGCFTAESFMSHLSFVLTSRRRINIKVLLGKQYFCV